MNIDELLESFEKTENAHLDTVGSEHIMLIHDSCVNQRGQVFSFKDNEFGVLTQLLEKTKLKRDEYQFVAAIKSLGVSEKDATTAMIHENRPLLEDNIKTADPDLIFVLGNLAMKTLLRKSGIGTKRGKEFWIDVDGKSVPVVPLYHPFSIYSEPKLRTLFIQDIDNAYDKFILGKNKLANSTYNLHNDVDSALKAMKHACTKDIVSIDIETTGLDYKKDKITSIGLATGDREAFVIPIYHRESELSDDDISRVRDSFTLLLKDPSIGKIFHNCKFDLKFLKNWGVPTFNNIHDTQIMHSLVDENKPHGLMDIVKEHWPRELEEF
jgi:uracil-DNA glycosylase family 4